MDEDEKAAGCLPNGSSFFKVQPVSFNLNEHICLHDSHALSLEAIILSIIAYRRGHQLGGGWVKSTRTPPNLMGIIAERERERA